MKKTGKLLPIALLRYLFYTLLFTAFSAQTSAAQDFTLEATVSESKIFIGEQFTVSVEVRGSTMRGVSLPELPEIPGVGILSSTPSRSTSISIVNGRTTTSTTYTFSLVAREKGQYVIPPISIEIDGETNRTNSINIEIIERGNLSSGRDRQLPDIFLKVEVDDENPVPGQQIVASLALYFKQGVEITSFQPSGGWRTDGFWKEELENIRDPQAESVILDGVRYRKATLLRFALFPSRSGTLSLSGFPLNVGIRTQSSRNDPFGSFFGSGGNQRRVSLESQPLEIDVQPLDAPAEGLSINAVGELSLQRRLNRTTAETGETVELITTIRGTGNIPLIRRPEYALPEGLDTYTPQETSNIERRGLSIRGTKTFTELMVPRAPGVFEIPGEKVAIFNPDNGRYRYANLPPLQFTVTAGSSASPLISGNITGQLQPVRGLAVWSQSGTSSFPQTGWFWVLLILPAAAFLIAYTQKRYYNRLQTDQNFARAENASIKADERIKKAHTAVENHQTKECYHQIRNALAGYISDKLSLPEAGFSDSELIARVQQKANDDALVKSLKTLLTKCATISYAPTGSSDDQHADIEKAKKLLTQLKKVL